MGSTKAAGTSSIAASLTREILHELIVDISIQEHRLAQTRTNRTRQASAHAGASTTSNGTLGAPAATNGASPSKKEREDGLFACMVCNRQIAAPRYASHLSGCMGLSGSRRGERRAAATNGRPIARTGSGASSYGSDTDTEKKNGGSGTKRASNGAAGSGQNKKSKPAPLSTATSSSGFQPPHIGSHPLSKTMSLPASPVASPTASSAPLPPRPSSVAPGSLPAHLQQQARKSPQPGANGVPLKSPAVSSAHGRHSLSQAHMQNGRQPSKSPARPLATGSVPPLSYSSNGSAATRSAAFPSNREENSDRPDSDSEDSDDSDLDAHHTAQAHGKPSQSLASMMKASKTPRVPPSQPVSITSTSNITTANGATAGGSSMQRNGSAPGHGAVSKKMPRKGMPNGAGPAGGVGRKAARPIAGVAHDSGSSDDDASDGSGSD